ncbi:MAG: YfgM family protein [Pirellulaceae bacterium]
MKSKRRHELQTNQLADQLGHWIERVRPYTSLFLLLAAGAVLILAAGYFWASTREKEQAESWRSYMLAGTNPQGDIVEELNLVTEQFEDTPAGLWAALTSADIESARGIRLMFTDRAAAETSLNLAKNRFRDLLESKHTAQDSLLLRRAHYGLAQVYEAQGELEEAKKQYAAVAEIDKDSALGKAAQERAERVDSTATKKWYNWFANQKPAPRDLGPGTPGAGSLGAPGTDLNVLPEGPDADFLKDLELESARPESAAPADPQTPAPAEAAPAETAPAETVPAETAPAETAPAETAPAETAPSTTPPADPAAPQSDPPSTDPPTTDPPADATGE